jgi:hypothetical protein
MSFIKDNGGPVALLGVGVTGFVALVVGYIELRLPSEAEIQQMVDAKFVAAGQVPAHRVDAVEEDIEDLEEEDAKLDSKIERIVGILLEE